jgi:undecaprenyl diphosphate synthase
MLREGIRLQVIGETSRLPVEVRQVLRDAVERTAERSAMTLTLALSYGSRDELLRAVRQIGTEVAAGRLLPEQIDEEVLSRRLDTAGVPDPDLLIRTSGEMRISNFLLWQIAYTELYFCEAYWPDFDRQELLRALEEYARRERRFGLTGSQVQGEGRH